MNDQTPTPKGNQPSDPVERLADLRHEFGEHGGVNMSIGLTGSLEQRWD
jgi:hypothetical protein